MRTLPLALAWTIRWVAAGALCLQLGACASSYDGPITNDAPHANTQGPPLLNGGFAP